jgi:hypothetical protein
MPELVAPGCAGFAASVATTAPAVEAAKSAAMASFVTLRRMFDCKMTPPKSTVRIPENDRFLTDGA